MIRILLSAVFIVSSLAKLVAIDDFELYVYSYGFFSLNTCYLLARLCIGIELLIGIMIGIGWYYRIVNISTFIILIFFSLFLCYAILNGRTESCQCMGKLVELPPSLSLLKNAILLIIILVYSRYTPPQNENQKHKRLKGVISIAIIIIALALPFCISIPDNWMFGHEDSLYNKELLQKTANEMNLDEGHMLVAFVTQGCPYCRMTREKLNYIATRNNLSSDKIRYIEPFDIGTDLFIQITYGNRPLVVLLDNGMPTTTYHYRNINEKEVTSWLQDFKQ